MTISDELKMKLIALKENMAARGQNVSMDELIQAHKRGLSGEKAQILDGLLQEAKSRVQSEVDAATECFSIEPDE